jgi:histidinol-phosphatase (PHP family)
MKSKILHITSDAHVHTTYSDGTASIDRMVKTAIGKGLKRIIITDHIPMPFDTDYAIKCDLLPAYRKEVLKAKEKYGDKIQIKLGLEVEYNVEHHQWIKQIVDLGWEFLLGSVHRIFTGERFVLINSTLDNYLSALNSGFQGDIIRMCHQYYHAVQTAIATGWFDAVGHFDVIKQYNTGDRFFDENALWYQNLVVESLNVMHKQGIKMEINTSGYMDPCCAPYPGPWIIEKAINRGIPLILGSDAHQPEMIANHFHSIAYLVGYVAPHDPTLSFQTQVQASQDSHGIPLA